MPSFSIASLASLPKGEREKRVRSLSPAEALALLYHWPLWARPEQLPPEPQSWATWLILSGRAWGKTRTGASWVNDGAKTVERTALIGRTAADVRDTMVEGESGILATAHPGARPRWNPSARRLTWPNGAIATTFTADEPEQLRGPQFGRAWCDELAAWRYGEETWDQLQMVLRLGDKPQACVTTTPRPTPLVRRLLLDSRTSVTRGSTFENKALPRAFLDSIRRQYEGTRIGRQELFAEVLDDNPGALFKRAEIDAARVAKTPRMRRIVVAVDPAVTSNENSAETGIIVVGLGEDGDGYVLDDRSLVGTPGAWAAAVVAAYHLHEADVVVGEVNNGGDLVAANVATADRSIPFSAVRASRGKDIRAEPVSTLYEQGRIHHVGALPQLEDQMCDWDPAGNAKSPDRLDALVWGITELGIADALAAGASAGRTTYRLGASRGF